MLEEYENRKPDYENQLDNLLDRIITDGKEGTVELAKLLIKCGAKVGIIGRTKSDGENAIKEIKMNNENSELFFIQGDLYSDEDRSKIFKSIEGIFPQGINHLVSFLGSGKTPFGTG